MFTVPGCINATTGRYSSVITGEKKGYVCFYSSKNSLATGNTGPKKGEVSIPRMAFFIADARMAWFSLISYYIHLDDAQRQRHRRGPR